MATVQFRVTRAPSVGFLSGDVVTFNMPTSIETESMEAVRRDTVAPSGVTQSVLRRVDVVYDVQTTYHPQGELPFYRMFLQSVAGGETFQFRGRRVRVENTSFEFSDVGRTRAFRIQLRLRLIPGASALASVFERYQWRHAVDFSVGNGGDIPVYAGGTSDLGITAGSYTAGGSTSGLNADAIGASRIDRALVASSLRMDNFSSDASGLEGVAFHSQILWRYDADANALTFGALGSPAEMRLGGNTSANRMAGYYHNGSDAEQVLQGTVFADGDWVLADLNVFPDGSATTLELYANGILLGTATRAMTFEGVGPARIRVGSANFSSPGLMWWGVRAGRQTQENHLRDATDLGLA